MKTWHKVAIGCGVALIFSCVLGAILIGLFGCSALSGIITTLTDLTDPDATLARAKEICDFDLPKDYDVTFALNIGFVKIAIIEHKPSKQMLMLLELPENMRIPNKEFKVALEKGTKEEIMEEINKNNKGGNFKIKDIKSTGVYDINGHEIPYFEAEFDHNGKPADGILGNYENPDTKKSFMIMAMAEKGKYSEDITLTFLKSLKF